MVYQYSKCTITATAAIDDTTGCFFNRDPDICLPTRVQFPRNQLCFPSASQQSILNSSLLPEDPSSTALQGYDIEQKLTWIRDITNAPVNQRSWVVQERLLSPRVLHFSDRQLYWECAELEASESSPFGIPEKEAVKFKTLSPLQHQDQYLNDLDFEVETPSRKYERLTRGFSIWGSAVSAYTSGKLSKGSDKLIAISVIARELQPLMRRPYLAGLWEVDLVSQLAPLVEILEVVIDFVSDDKFGQVQGGHLNLLGQTIDLEVLERKSKVERSKVLFNGKLSSAWILEDLANIRTETSTNQLSYLPLHIDLYGNQFYITGLILECVDVTRNEYRRVGLLEYSKIIPFGSGHTGKVSIEDPFLSTIGDIEQTEYGTHVFKKRSADLREITII
ncbi:uncharacterized protein EAE97_006688 [Botrytis byssoidea]|uniref:Heterokaryon incompatibility domain-containing protein n=1 Tax=Botrytis byssoidea TaxID=139641 RepID=A0A9P5LYR5_9HELO|nr:uncharacterized protein EAE97_006688 [Botrytis byssoidea]KAF7941851.1 hypothetical protein EAE97_006688 [Botrytis byssoidea]